MRLAALSALALASLHAPAAEPDLIAKTDALAPADTLKKFKVPEGFAVQLVAAEPDIQKPMQMAFDAKGRMWVTTSFLYPFAAAEGKGTDKLFVLSDFDEKTGKAKKIEVFDDKLNIPIGVLPLPDGKSVIVSECGKILKLTDTDGDMKADKREVLFSGFGFKDTHGMTNSFTLLPDGWVYACHGFANDSKTKGTDGHEITMNSGHTFRFKPDGSRIEVFTRGQVNPFGLTVDPWFNLYSSDCHSKPITQLVRGSYYDSFGKPHDGLGYGPHVTAHSHNSTGICGPLYYAADHFPKEWQGRMLVCNVVTSRINADFIQWKGSSPVAKEDADFLVSDDPWFRPVDLKLGPDGAVYVSDFYNKIIGHYEVDIKHPGRDHDHGRLWRIVYVGKDGKGDAPKMPRADWAKCDDNTLLEDFISPNTTVRLLAANEAAARKEFKPTPNESLLAPATASLAAGLLAQVQERHGTMKAENYKTVVDYARAQKLPAESLTGLIVRALTSRTDWGDDERKIALDCFKSFDSVRIHRAVLDGITAHPHADFIDPLLEFIPKIATDDTHMKLAAKIALRNCLEVAADYKLTIEKGAKPADFRPLAESLMGCTQPKAVGLLGDLLGEGLITEEQAFEAGRRMGRYGEPQRWKSASETANKLDDDSLRTLMRVCAGVFRGMQEGGYKPGADPRRDRVFTDVLVLSTSRAETALFQSEPLARVALDLYREAKPVAPANWLVAYSDRLSKGLESRKLSAGHAAIVAEVALLYGGDAARPTVRKMLEDAEPNSPLFPRLIPLLLANGPTTADCTVAVTALKTAAYKDALAYAVALAGDKFGADLLLASVKKGEAPARLLQEKAVTDRLAATKVPDLDAKLKELTKGIPAVEKKIEDLIKFRTAGFPKAKTDAAKGKLVFTKQCAICHTLNNEGAKVGPQLDGVGIRGVARLLEDTLDPNRHVDQAFRATKLDLKDGQSLTGLVREDGAVYVLVDPAGKEKRVPAADVDKKATTPLSAMPANLDAVMTEEEYYHLLAFLLEQKAKK